MTQSASRSREPIIYAVVLGFGLAVVSTVWFRLLNRRISAAEAATAYDDCRSLATEIAQLKARPVRAAFGRGEAKDITPRLAELAGSTSRGASLIESVDPEAERPVGQTAYSTQNTTISLAALPMSELVDFLYALEDRELATRVGAINVTLVTGSNQTEGQWASRLILTRLIYQPITAPPSSLSPTR